MYSKESPAIIKCVCVYICLAVCLCVCVNECVCVCVHACGAMDYRPFLSIINKSVLNCKEYQHNSASKSSSDTMTFQLAFSEKESRWHLPSPFYSFTKVFDGNITVLFIVLDTTLFLFE